MTEPLGDNSALERIVQCKNLPQEQRERPAVEQEVVVVGVFDHLQIWSGPVWDTYEADVAGAYASGALDLDGR